MPQFHAKETTIRATITTTLNCSTTGHTETAPNDILRGKTNRDLYMERTTARMATGLCKSSHKLHCNYSNTELLQYRPHRNSIK
ncbi:hypothetical protein HKD37_04G011379 [Glycine soja]